MKRPNYLLVDILLMAVLTVVIMSLPENLVDRLQNLSMLVLVGIFTGIPLVILGLVLYKGAKSGFKISDKQKAANKEYEQSRKEEPWRFR